MLQIGITTFASDALEDAMRLAQTKALNSFTYSDCLNYLNYTWSDVYSRMAEIDPGYYSVNVKLDKKLTTLPPFVKNTIKVYRAQSPIGYNRIIYRESGTADMTASGTYHISGNELYCPDADSRTIWLEYVPQPPQIFFTHHNRDPIIHESYVVNRNELFGSSTLKAYNTEGEEIKDWFTASNIEDVNKWVLYNRITDTSVDITEDLQKEDYTLTYISCDLPYIFCSYRSNLDGSYLSGFFYNGEWTSYNPFDFTGTGSNVEYLYTKHNDKTGLSAVVKDYNNCYDVTATTSETTTSDTGTIGTITETEYSYTPAMKRITTNITKVTTFSNGIYTTITTTETITPTPVIKELGWTPDTILKYPIPEMYRYLVARLADKFSALNESNVMGVQLELQEATAAFNKFLDRNKSAFSRIENVNPATIMDYIV